MAAFQIRAFLAIAILFLPVIQVRAQSYEDGIAAFEAGDYAVALSHWRQLAKQGHAEAQYNLGIMHEYARGVGQNDVAASKWYEKAAKQGVAVAQYRLAVLHEHGWGIPQDSAEAVRWYSKAAAQGHAFAQHDLAFMYVAGTGVPQNYVQAYMWLNIAVAQGNNLMVKHLNHVAKKLTVAQLKQAHDLAREWTRKHQ